MKKNIFSGRRLNFFLILIVAGLLFIAIQKPGLNHKTITRKISQLNIDQVQHIHITSTDKKQINFSKRKQSWYISTEEGDKMIENNKLQPFVNLLNADSLESFSATQNQLAQYHLLKPRLTIKFDDFAIDFGDSEPLKHRRYVLIDNQVHLITDLYYHFLLQAPDSYLKTQKQ